MCGRSLNSALRSGSVEPPLAGALGVAALGHEAGDHAVEGQAVVEALAASVWIRSTWRGDVGAQLDDDRAAVRQLERQPVGGIGGDRRRRQ